MKQKAVEYLPMAYISAIDGVVPVVHPNAFISETATLIGDVIIGENCYVGPGASLRGDMGRIVICAGSNVQDGVLIHAGARHDTVVGENAIVSHGAMLHGCEIKQNALVGIRSVIMDGAIIGEQALVAAMSFVTAGFEVPARSLVMGIPARVRRSVTEGEIAFMTRGATVYQDLAYRSSSGSKPCKPLRKVSAKRLAQRISAAHGDETGSGTPAKTHK
jgi:phenylacetic acid degradation protein